MAWPAEILCPRGSLALTSGLGRTHSAHVRDKTGGHDRRRQSRDGEAVPEEERQHLNARQGECRWWNVTFQ